jgi:hypothetical protein
MLYTYVSIKPYRRHNSIKTPWAHVQQLSLQTQHHWEA